MSPLLLLLVNSEITLTDRKFVVTVDSRPPLAENRFDGADAGSENVPVRFLFLSGVVSVLPHTLRFLTSVIALSLGAVAFGQESPSRPNIVLIIADDLGWNDCGPYGHTKIRTPNLDRLAKDSLRFDRAFLTTSSCSPSRASIITGRYPHSTHAEQLHLPLPTDQIIFPELLRKHGYFTAASGKWHLGAASKPKLDLVKEGGGASGCENWVSTLKACPKGKPFFLWLASFDPHRPYAGKAVAKPHTPDDVRLPPFIPDTPEVRQDFAMYYDEVSRLDGYIGQVLDELDRQKLAENTVVFFITDNGRPFPRCKTTLYDSGIQTPLLARWPAKIRPGSTTSLVSTVDLAPTILELAGVKIGGSFQGRSFAKVLHDPTAVTREYIHAEHNWHDFDDHQRAVRSNRFLYIRNSYTDIPLTPPADAVRSPTYQMMQKLHAAGKLTPEQSICFQTPRSKEELYDVVADPYQLRNLAGDAAHAKTLTTLRTELKRWETVTGDHVPAQRRPDGFDRLTGESLKKKTGSKK